MIHDDMICKNDIKTKTKAKLQRKAKLEYNNQSSPPLKREKNSKLPSQASKPSLVKRLCKDVCKLVLGGYMDEINVTFFIVVSEKVETDFDVFGFGVKHWILCNTNGTRAITEKWHSPILKSEISQSGNHP